MNIKKLFIIFLSLVLAFGVAIPAYAVSDVYTETTMTGQYLELGDNHITGADPDTVSIYYFVAPDWSSYGIYRVTLTGDGAELRSYCGSVGYRYDNTAQTDYDPETNSYSFTVYTNGEKHLIGVTGAEEFDVSITKTGVIKLPQWYDTSTEYSSMAPSQSPEKFNIITSEDCELKYVDITTSHTVYVDKDNYYHLDSKDGPILYMDMYMPTYIDLYSMAHSGILKCTLFSNGATGSLRQKTNFSDLYREYAYCADPNLGIFPLNRDLITMLKNMGAAKGWYDKDLELGYYLFGDMTVDKESAWMFPLCYFENADDVKIPDGSKELPYLLVCDNYDGSFCTINSESSVFYNLDIPYGSDIACMGISFSGKSYTAFDIAYGDQIYSADSDGLISFSTDGSSDTIEIINKGSQDAIFALMLSSSAPTADGSTTFPYISSVGYENAVSMMLAPGESVYCIADPAYNTSAHVFAIDESYSYSNEFHVEYYGYAFGPDSSNEVSVELDWHENFYEIYNDSNENLNIFTYLSEVAPDVPFLDGSEESPYILYCDSPWNTVYTLDSSDSIYFDANYSDYTYVVVSASNENMENSTEIYANYNGNTIYPFAAGFMIVPLTGDCHTLEICSSSEEVLSLEIYLVSDISYLNPVGTFENPYSLLQGEYIATLSNSSIYCSYTATESGTLTFTILDTSADGWMFDITNVSKNTNSGYIFSDSANSNEYKLNVSKGDTIIFNISTYDKTYPYIIPEGTVSWGISCTPCPLGDVDLDCSINSKDSNYLRRIISGSILLEPDSEMLITSDINQDGIINSIDSNLLKRYLVGETD